MDNERDIYDNEERIKIHWNNIYASSDPVTITLFGFLAGALVVALSILALVVILLGGAVLQLNMMITGFLKPESIGKGQSIYEILMVLKNLVVSVSPAFVISGIIGIIAAKFKQIGCKTGKYLSFLGNFIEISYDQIVFFAVFLALCIAYGLFNMEGKVIVFDTLVPDGNRYSFWTIVMAFSFISIFLGGIFYNIWASCYKFLFSAFKKN
ncbi:MAG: hypothetical protein A3J83_03145 [Elusimicrobia bacterium RIFOXYA2_FULL_40_6]|nr:MAG: hypothetical protein A3J83_03145 [Elusimicrobia bacterium RIFOXYA2_FULL_40_6]